MRNVYTTVVSREDERAIHRIEEIIRAYRGNDLLHDIELKFPGASYRAFFIAARKTIGEVGARLIAHTSAGQGLIELLMMEADRQRRVRS